MALSDTILFDEEEEEGEEGEENEEATGGSGSKDNFTDTQVTLLITLILLAGLLMLLGYLWVIVTVARTRRLHTASDSYLASLAVAEIVLAVCGLPAIFILSGSSGFSFASVLFLSWGILFSVLGYFLNAVLIATDKWLRISRPFVYVREMTRAKCAVCLSVVWGLSAAGSLAGAVTHASCLMGDFSKDRVFSSFSLLAIIFSYAIILPCVTTITVFNILIVRIARHQARAIAADLPAAPRQIMEGPPGEHRMQPPGNQPHPPGAVHRKSTRQFSIFFLSFVLAWTPVVVTLPIVHYTEATDDNMPVVVVLLIASMFVLCQAAFGTLILTVLQREYREILKGDLRGIGEKLHCIRRR
ncbi:beta-1 adrenergic receptor-like [Patiria miniata]|uniref:G-protein coupled receptors family 1 profile domain-containing protein n=1 Tax=Patiria miniata TaxID=46514 RepID=A0A914B902_PATMI|nr:beta-1 adrenergic receptor-like [Patiria miniata]